MADTINDLMMKNFQQVFGEPDPVLRRAAIEAVYAPTSTLAEPDSEVAGYEAINAQVSGLHKQFPGFVFKALGPVESHHGMGRLRWQYGLPGQPPAVTGMDIALVENGQIKSLHVFLDHKA